jgi:hypothetical protein
MKSKKHTRLAIALSAILLLAAGATALALGAGRADNVGLIELRQDAENSNFDTASSSFEPRKWLDYYQNEQMPWDGSEEITLPEYPGVTFKWTTGKVTAQDSNGVKELFGGMPIWNVYLADLNGDELPEFCATISYGSGLVDTRIVVYDYANETQYDLSDRMFYDYALSLENGRLMVTQKPYIGANDGASLGYGELAIIDGELTAIGIDRTLPELEPRETTPPRDAPAMPYEGFYQVIRKLYVMDPGLNNGIKYIAVDMEGVFEGERSALEAEVREWADTLGGELLLNNYQGLVESGYITPPMKDGIADATGFKEGILFSFNDTYFKDDTLTVRATKYRGPLGAVGAQFTARFGDGNWTVDEPEMVLES